MEAKVVAKSQADMMALVAKLVPEGYLESGSGSEIVYAIGKVGERLSLAAKRLFDGLTPGTAIFGGYATGTVTLSRTDTTVSGTLEAGSILWSVNGDRLLTTQDATWIAPDVTDRTINVIAMQRSYQSNLTVDTVLGVHTPIPAPLFDTSLIGKVVSLSGGVSPMLETLASERSLGRHPSESLASLRKRIHTLEDIVTPNAIRKIATDINPDAELIEAWDTVAFTDYAWWTDGSYTLTAGDGLNNRLAETTCTGWFYICVPLQIVSLQDLTWLCDDYGHTDYQDGYCANSLWATAPDGSVYDMGDWGIRPDIQPMVGKIDLARAGGVFWFIEEG